MTSRATPAPALLLGMMAAAALIAAPSVSLAQSAANLAMPPSLAPVNSPANSSALSRGGDQPQQAPQPQNAQGPQPPPLSPNAPLFSLPTPSDDGRQVLRTGGPGGPDLSALRYYLQSKQKERADAEIARIQRLYPGWRVPQEVYAPAPVNTVDEEPFWALYAQDKLPELKAAVEAKMASTPGWQPSRDLVRKVRRKELRLVVEKMAKDGQQKQIVSYVKESGFGPTEIDIDILWLIAEAQAKSGLPDEALKTYKSILQTDDIAQERLATVQKAMAVLPMSMVDQLVAMGRTINGKSEFSPIALDITRGRISAFLKEERTTEIDPAEMQAFETYARATEDPNQAALVAWYNYNRKDYRTALDWFKLSIDKGGDAMVAHGLALTLVNLTMYREAEEVAYAWRNALINNMILYVDILERDLTKEIPPYIETERLVRYGQVAMELTSGEAAQGLAWYAYNSCQYDVALQWFERAMAWFPKEPTAYGIAISLDRLKRKQNQMEIINRYDGLFAKVVEIVFPDGRIRPPNPCDNQTAARGSRRDRTALVDQGQVAANPGMNTTGGPYLDQAFAQQQPQRGRRNAPQNMQAVQGGQGGVGPRVPTPSGASYYAPGQSYNQADTFGATDATGGIPPMPKLDRKDFPISVNPANPFRFAAVGRNGAQSAAAAASFAAPGRYAQETFRGPWPLVARFVPGIGPMPYARYGFTLLPGWNGTDKPTEPPYSQQNAPAGTLWADQRHADQFIAGR